MITITHNILRRPRGIVRLWEHAAPEAERKQTCGTGERQLRKAHRAGGSVNCVPDFVRAARLRPRPADSAAPGKPPRRLIFELDNLYVNAGLPVLANLLATGTAGYVAAAVGFGSGNTPPAVTDTDLTTTPKYYNAIGTHTIGPSGSIAAGSVLFNYALATTDYAANPLTIQELGLFANSAAMVLPVLVGGAFGAWVSLHAYAAGNLLIDSNGNTQRCTTAGTSGAAAPSWATTMGGTTTDSTVTWTLAAMHTAPSPMIAHVVVPAFPYTGGANYSGTWTISM
jgi:hypothetical protein